MKPDEVKKELARIAANYPTLMGLLKKKLPSGKTLGQQWGEVLSDLNSYYLEEVCSEFAELKRPLPDPIDQLVFEIRDDVVDRTHRDFDAFVQHEKYHKARQRTKEPTRFMRAMRASARLGRMCAEGIIDETTKSVRVAEVAEWQKDGNKDPAPDWLVEMEANGQNEPMIRRP